MAAALLYSHLMQPALSVGDGVSVEKVHAGGVGGGGTMVKGRRFQNMDNKQEKEFNK